MAKIDTSHAKNSFNFTAPANVQYETPTLTVSPTQFSWVSETNADLDIFGEDLTYSGTGATQEMSGGTINSVSIDVNNDGGDDWDLLITGIAGDAAKIDKDNPASFWNEILKGDDEFDLTGMSADKMINGGGVYFGDDLSAQTTFFPQGATDGGGNDVMTGGDNSFLLMGDASEVRGSVVGNLTFSAVYDAGDDTITSAITTHTMYIYGDAYVLGPFATLHAGNDILNNSGGTNEMSYAIGDIDQMFGGVLNGGNDVIDTDSSNSPIGVGDLARFNSGTANGGNDTIVVRGGSALVTGDVAFVDPNATGSIVAGNDTIAGRLGEDVLIGDVNVRGSLDVSIAGGRDTISGGGGADMIYGETQIFTSFQGVTGGNDRLLGNAGNDTIFGQIGNDVVLGGIGNDILNGGRGIDRASYSTASAGVTVSLADANTQDTGGAGLDTLSRFENLWGSGFADTLTGNRLANTLTGDAGKDLLRGGLGNDTLRGGFGGDTLNGGRGLDSLGGGAGGDTFLFTALNQSGPTAATADRITDLSAFDLIDLSDIDANGAGLGNGTFVRIGNSAAFSSAGQLRLSVTGGDTRLQLNTDGDSAAEFTVLLTGNHAGAAAEDDWLL